MMKTNNLRSRLIVILDREYGEQLKAIWPGQPIWIEFSPINEAVIRAMWLKFPESSSSVGITGFKFESGVSPEGRFLNQLATIDLHHGPYSTDAPYTELEVIGCLLDPSIRVALTATGFTEFETRNDGFAARRSIEQAAIKR